ncbi:hypothetical protein [Arthrobacter sp. CG_A4]|uniref:hypothetical protein n=1 Tax=Arthrobacter sp. CG_A4 TaxID=3071706 RepID=UPI002E11E8A2
MAAPAAPPTIVTAEIHAAVASVTGSPLSVQVITVMILLGLGFVYFRFLGGKSRGLAAKAEK